MRSFAASTALALAMASGAAANRPVNTITPYTDPGPQVNTVPPTALKWSYFPNSFGRCTASVSWWVCR